MLLAGLMIASTLMQAHGQQTAGQAAKNAAENNAAMARYEAEYQTKKGKIEADAIERKGNQMMGQQKLLFANSGVDVSSGSALDSLKQMAYNVNYDMQNKLFGADMESAISMNKANSAEYSGSMAKYSANIGTTATLLGGAASVYGAYKEYDASKSVSKGASNSGAASVYDASNKPQ